MHTPAPIATVDVRELHSLSWQPMRALFPAFADKIELARYPSRNRRHTALPEMEKRVTLNRAPAESNERRAYLHEMSAHRLRTAQEELQLGAVGWFAGLPAR